MRYFTNSPYERIMRDTSRSAPDRPAPPPKHSPCYGCGNYPGPCVFCWRKTVADWKAERTERAASKEPPKTYIVRWI